MAKKTVLATGIDPSLVDFSAFPGLTLELVRNFIDTQIVKLRAQGYDAESCLIDLGETAEEVTTTALRSKSFDCVVIGAGLRCRPRNCCCSKRSSTSFTPSPRPPESASTPGRPTPWKRCSAGSALEAAAAIDRKRQSAQY